MKKKIVLSELIIMVLIFTFVMSVTVLAWVSVISGIKIQDIQVTPAGADALSIKNTSSGSKFAFTVSPSSNTVNTLNPVSTYDLTNWYKPQNIVSINEDGTASDSTVFESVNTAEKANYYYQEKFWVTTSASMTNFRVSNIVVKDGDGNSVQTDYSKSLRVGIICGSKSYIFAPVEGADKTCEAIQEVDGSIVNKAQPVIYNMNQVLMSTINKDEDFAVEVFVWYEGEDENCVTKDLSAESLKINIEFTADPNINSDVG